MIQTIQKAVTFDEFIDWYPENSEHRYELHNGVIVKIAHPLGKHEEVTGFLASELTAEFRKLKLPYFIPKQALVRHPVESLDTCQIF